MSKCAKTYFDFPLRLTFRHRIVANSHGYLHLIDSNSDLQHSIQHRLEFDVFLIVRCVAEAQIRIEFSVQFSVNDEIYACIWLYIDYIIAMYICVRMYMHVEHIKKMYKN